MNIAPQLLQLIQDSIQSAFKLISVGNEGPRYYNLIEAENYCNLAVPTFRAHLAKRNVSGSKPGKRWIFCQEDLDDFLKKFRRRTRFESSWDIEDIIVNQRKTSQSGK